MEIPTEIVGIDCKRSGEAAALTLSLADGATRRCRTVVIASGARYRQPQCSGLKNMEGHGVWYWASPIEAKMCAGQEVVVVGGGNSAGQGAVYLSGFAGKVWMLVRGSGLAASMSKYLIDRLESIPNVEILARTEIVDIAGSQDSGLESVTWRDHATGREVTRPVRNVFLFLGADPHTEWLTSCGVGLDDKGFVKTGEGKLPLETSVPGIFAIGDVRAGSVKRVGGAIGEGAAVVAQIHAFFASSAA
jgi:thioredoxin reductase (NADPH)